MPDDYATIPPRRLAEALTAVGFSPIMRKLLTVHYAAKGHVMTMKNLARDSGYANYNAANLQYGLLAFRMAEFLEVEVPPTRLSLLCEFIRPNAQSNREWLIIMRPNFARALELAEFVQFS